MSKVIVIGGGAAGMFAAITAAKCGHEVAIYEKNEKLGKKLFITGKGRCNITNACDMEDLFASVTSNSKFLFSAFYGYNNYDVIDFFENAGLKTKIERGMRVFPESDKSSDVIAALSKQLRDNCVDINLHSEVTDIVVSNGKFDHIVLGGRKKEYADAVIITTGGLSYKTTGSTGDGYKFAEKMGHKVSELSASLVPFNVKEEFVKELQGLSLKNTKVTIYDGKKRIYDDFGEMLFTHYGVSGPMIISASSKVNKQIKKNNLILSIDLKPALTEEQLDARILRDFEEVKNKQFKNSIDGLLPKKMTDVMIRYTGIDPDKKVNEITKEERKKLVDSVKNFRLTLTSLRDYNEAIITKGGISVKEVNPTTMESKLVKNVFFAGEVLDLDALTGGFNLQIAWSTAYAAGSNIQ